jgi:poly(3-hydroxybutyrate) depolymerase
MKAYKCTAVCFVIITMAVSFSALGFTSRQGTLAAKTIKCGKETRSYYEYVPTGYKPRRAAPLVVMLHGAGGNGLLIDGMTKWSTLAEKNNFIAVFPNSSEWWKAYQWDNNNDEVFLTALIKKVQKDYQINNKRIYMCGYSIGGGMTVTYAFKHAKTLAAIALASPVWMQYDQMFNIDPYKLPQPKTPLPVYAWRGEYEGWPSDGEIKLMIKYWTDFNHTKKTPEVVKQSVYTTYAYTGGKADVLYTEIAYGTHFSYTPDDFAKIWYDFFARQKRKGLF